MSTVNEQQQQQQQQLSIQRQQPQQQQLLVPPQQHQQVKPGQFHHHAVNGEGGGAGDSGCCTDVTGRAGELLKKVPPCTCKSISHAPLALPARAINAGEEEGSCGPCPGTVCQAGWRQRASFYAEHSTTTIIVSGFRFLAASNSRNLFVTIFLYTVKFRFHNNFGASLWGTSGQTFESC